MNREEEFMRRSHKLINKLIDTADELGMCLVGGFYFRKKNGEFGEWICRTKQVNDDDLSKAGFLISGRLHECIDWSDDEVWKKK